MASCMADDLDDLLEALWHAVWVLPVRVVRQEGQVLHASELRGALHRIEGLVAKACRTLDEVRARGDG